MIGLWIARFRGEDRRTLYHLCESEITDRKVTHCGRQLAHIEGTLFREYAGLPPKPLTCYPCELGKA